MTSENKGVKEMTGGCACGAVRYTITGDPGFSFLCHCRRCQQVTGTGHAPGFKVDNKDITITGQLKSYDVPSDSGAMASHKFCPECGSPVISATERFPEACSVYAGSLDDPSLYKPQAAIFRETAQPWDHVDPELLD